MIDIGRLEQRLKFDHENMGDGFRANMMTTEALELITRLRESERDAARYRWLRDYGRYDYYLEDLIGEDHIEAAVDARIDNAMKEKGDE